MAVSPELEGVLRAVTDDGEVLEAAEGRGYTFS